MVNLITYRLQLPQKIQIIEMLGKHYFGLKLMGLFPIPLYAEE